MFKEGQSLSTLKKKFSLLLASGLPGIIWAFIDIRLIFLSTFELKNDFAIDKHWVQSLLYGIQYIDDG